MKLENVAVKLTEKNIGKVYDILKMFGEDIYSETEFRLKNSMLSDVFSFIHFSDANHWTGVSGRTEKALIKPSQLKQLLAKERLKGGDVVIVDNNKDGLGSRWILDLTGNNISSFEHSNSYDLNLNEIDFYADFEYPVIVDGKFIRFATEEEKSLLNPKPEKKELEIGKWYKAYLSNKGGYLLAVFNGYNNTSYGIHPDEYGGWFSSHNWFNDFNISRLEYTEATHEEMEQALINEAKKRYTEGDIIELIKTRFKSHYIILNNLTYSSEDNSLVITFRKREPYAKCSESFKYVLFKDGKWAEIIESPKIEPGNWYKNETSLMYSVDGIKAYGIVNGDWIENGKCYGDGWTKLSVEDAHKELLVFIKNFYSVGDVVECLAFKNIRKITKYEHSSLSTTIGYGKFWSMSGDLGMCLMKDGKFARKLQKIGV